MGPLKIDSLGSKRFRLVSEQWKTEERDSRFWPLSFHFSRGNACYAENRVCMCFSQACGRISKSESTLTLAQNGNCVSLLYLIWFHGQVGSIQRTALKMPLWNPGGGTWVFWGCVCAARDSKLAARLKKVPLKLIPRSRNGTIFYTSF